MDDAAVEADKERSSLPPQTVSSELTNTTTGTATGPSAAAPVDHVTTGSVSKGSPSWFQRSSTPTGTSSTVKHSLLAMVPSQPLSRPSSATPPSPARNLQPPSIPALAQTKLPSPTLPETAAGSPAVSEQDAKAQVQQQATVPGILAKIQEDAAHPEQDNAVKTIQSQQETEQQVADKKLRRDKRVQKTAASMHWQLMRRLADISTDVEMLNHEVARIKYEQSSSLVTEDQKELTEADQEQLEALRQKRWMDLITRQCSTVLKSVQSHKWAFPFAKPVDATIFKDYPIIITQPIDFATIKSKLDGARYKQPQQFHDDMKLVFANARRYNPPGSDVNLMANGVEEKFDERWQALLMPKLAEEDMHTRTDEAAVRRQRLDKAQARLAGELEQHRLRLSTAFDSLHSAILDAKSLAAAACKPVSHRHKEALVPALDALTAEQFEWAMSLVHARYPGLPSGPGEEMQFDITCLDSLALRQLMDFTQACAKAAQGSEGTDTQVTWPPNPVGVGSRGHKPQSNKRARRSPTPTPLDPSTAAHVPQAHVIQSNPQPPLAHQQAPQPGCSAPQPNHVAVQPKPPAANPQAPQTALVTDRQQTYQQPVSAGKTATSRVDAHAPGQLGITTQQLNPQQQDTRPNSSLSEARTAPQHAAAANVPSAHAQGELGDVAAPLTTFSQPAPQTVAATQGSQLPGADALLQPNHQQAPLGGAPFNTMHNASQRSQMHNTHASADEAASVDRQNLGSAQPAKVPATQSSSLLPAGSALPTLLKQATALPSQQLPAPAQSSFAQPLESGPTLHPQLPQAPPTAAGSASITPAPAAAALTIIRGEDKPGSPTTSAAAAAAAAIKDPSPLVATTATLDQTTTDAAKASSDAQNAYTGAKRKASETAPDASVQQGQMVQLPFASAHGQQPAGVTDEPVQKKSRQDDNLTGTALPRLNTQQTSVMPDQIQIQPAATSSFMQEQQLLQQRHKLLQQQALGQRPAPSDQQTAAVQAAALVGQPQHTAPRHTSSQQLHKEAPALDLEPRAKSPSAEARAELQPDVGAPAAAAVKREQASSDAHGPVSQQPLSALSQRSEDGQSGDAEDESQLATRADAEAQASKDAESEEEEDESRMDASTEAVTHAQQPSTQSQPSEEADSDGEEEEEEESESESEPKAQRRTQTQGGRGRGRGRGGANAKQEVRTSQRKPSRSKKSIAAGNAAGRGRKPRGRASTPAARAVSAQKPQRTTSRKTAGKRRRSPS